MFFRRKIFSAPKKYSFLFDIYIIFEIDINIKEDQKSLIIINGRYYVKTIKLLNLHCNKTDGPQKSSFATNNANYILTYEMT